MTVTLSKLSETIEGKRERDRERRGGEDGGGRY